MRERSRSFDLRTREKLRGRRPAGAVADEKRGEGPGAEAEDLGRAAADGRLGDLRGGNFRRRALAAVRER